MPQGLARRRVAAHRLVVSSTGMQVDRPSPFLAARLLTVFPWQVSSSSEVKEEVVGKAVDVNVRYHVHPNSLELIVRALTALPSHRWTSSSSRRPPPSLRARPAPRRCARLAAPTSHLLTRPEASVLSCRALNAPRPATPPFAPQKNPAQPGTVLYTIFEARCRRCCIASRRDGPGHPSVR